MKKKIRKNFKTKVIATALAAVLCVSLGIPAYGSNLTEAKDQKEQAESGLADVQSEMADIEEKQAALQEEINQVDAELVEVIYNLEITKEDLETTRQKLAEAEADLDVARADEQEQYEAMKTRIAYMYRNSDTGLLETLLSAGSFSEVLNQVTFYSDIYDYDRAALTTYQETKAEVQALVDEVSEQEANLEEVEATLTEQEEELNTLKAEKQQQNENYAEELEQAESLAAQYKETISDLNDAIARYEAEEAAAAAAAEAEAQESNYATSTEVAASATGQAVANYALQFVGNPYVWGGTSLTNGADCSGFVMSVFAHFGISLPHSSYAQASCGTGVSSPAVGDIICYGGHVAIYIGGGAIVHASTASTGIKVSSNYRYRSIVAIRRLV